MVDRIGVLRRLMGAALFGAALLLVLATYSGQLGRVPAPAGAPAPDVQPTTDSKTGSHF